MPSEILNFRNSEFLKSVCPRNIVGILRNYSDSTGHPVFLFYKLGDVIDKWIFFFLQMTKTQLKQLKQTKKVN